jgi:shikimate dehydrogenase
MKVFGLIGKPLSHAFSQDYFNQKFEDLGLHDHVYELFNLSSIDLLPVLIRNNKDLAGLNVTIPYKIAVMESLQELDNTAREAGAVNTIRITRNGDQIHCKGYNTDVTGFSRALKPFLESKHDKALILGNGGAAQAVKYVLKQLGIPFFIVTRNPSAENHISWDDLSPEVVSQCKLIINTTPLGMFPNIVEFPPIAYEAIGKDHYVHDLIYNPAETPLLRKSKERGALVQNGITMLHQQAEEAWKIWSA